MSTSTAYKHPGRRKYQVCPTCRSIYFDKLPWKHPSRQLPARHSLEVCASWYTHPDYLSRCQQTTTTSNLSHRSPSSQIKPKPFFRNKNIETWDIRKLPPACPTGTQRRPPGVPAHRPPRRLDDLGCRANSPDFWVEPHGLCVAVHGAPRHSQRFGAKHVFWPWPKPAAGTWSCSLAPPLARSGSGGDGNGVGGGDSIASRGGDTPTFSVGGQDPQGRRGGGDRRGGGTGIRAGFELTVPGVVSDSDYRLCLSTGIKFTDTHMATVLDSSRVLMDEMMLVASAPRDPGGFGGRVGAGVATPVLLAA